MSSGVAYHDIPIAVTLRCEAFPRQTHGLLDRERRQGAVETKGALVASVAPGEGKDVWAPCIENTACFKRIGGYGRASPRV